VHHVRSRSVYGKSAKGTVDKEVAVLGQLIQRHTQGRPPGASARDASGNVQPESKCAAIHATRSSGRGRESMVDFGKSDELRRWLGEQPRQVGIALAARSALRVLPMIGTPSTTAGTGPLLLADAIHVQAHFRLLSIAWAAFGQSLGDPWIAARARSAAAVSLPIGTLFTSPAASTARRSAANVVRALTTSGQDSIDALVAAFQEAYSAEAEFPGDARGASALAVDVEFLADRAVLHLARVPLWSSRPPAWPSRDGAS
jgi:hypothetical protein